LGPLSSFYFGFFDSGPPRTFALRDFIAGSSHAFFILNSINIGIFLLVLLSIVGWLFYNFQMRRRQLLFALCLFAPLGWLSGGFSLWMGVAGFVQRTSLYMVYPAVAVVALGEQIGKAFAVLMIACVLIAIPVTLFIHIQSPYSEGGRATLDEEELSKWTVRHTSDDQVVFTDLRLSGLFVSQGHFYVVGVSDSGSSANYVPTILDGLFYHPNSDNFKEGIDLVEASTGFRIDFVYVSSRMIMDYPGIRGYDYTYKPAAEGFMAMYDEIQNISLVSDGGESRLYVLPGT
jgi:hypothetical protein